MFITLWVFKQQLISYNYYTQTPSIFKLLCGHKIYTVMDITSYFYIMSNGTSDASNVVEWMTKMHVKF